MGGHGGSTGKVREFERRKARWRRCAEEPFKRLLRAELSRYVVSWAPSLILPHCDFFS